MQNNTFDYTKIRENIWQIAEDNGVCCTLVKGSKLAVLIDTGYGNRNLKAFVEENITTPYMVINSHGHPDHIGGNHWFDTVYALQEEWDVINHFEENKLKKYTLKALQIGQCISLGDLTMEVVSLAGHTKGSIGFIVQEEGIFIAGDALNESLWLFNYGSLSMADVYNTIKATMELGFSTYLCGHSHEEFRKEKLFSHVHNIETLKINSCTKQETIGFETYCSKYEDTNGISEIVFTTDKITCQ